MATVKDSQTSTCVQCSQPFAPSLNEDNGCRYHCGKLVEEESLAWYSCCPDQRVPLEDIGSVSGCTRGRHSKCHHTEYPYAKYTSFINSQSVHAKEVWLNLNVPDYAGLGQYRWIEVGLSESSSVFALAGNQDQGVEYAEISVDNLKACKCAEYTLLDHRSDSGWEARVQVQCRGPTHRVIVAFLKPSSSPAPLVKSTDVYIHRDALRVGRCRLLEGEEKQILPSNLRALPRDLRTGPQLELGSDYLDFSKGRKNDYPTQTENGSPIELLQVGETTVFARSHQNNLENVFTAVVMVTNTAEQKLTITEVYGEYLNNGNEWTKCDNILITKNFFPGMYKWCLGSSNISLSPGFTDTLSAQLSVTFENIGSISSQPLTCRAHSSLPQPLHLKVTFVTGGNQSASLRFEQGNPSDIPTRTLREEQWQETEILGYLFADDANERQRIDVAMNYDLVSGRLYLHRAVSGQEPVASEDLWPHIHLASHKAKISGMSQCEIEGLSLMDDSGRKLVRVCALVDLVVGVTYALKVEITTSTSATIGHWRVPYINAEEATMTLQPAVVCTSQEFTVEWSVPRACKSDSIGIFRHFGKSPVSQETNKLGLPKGTLTLKAPAVSGCYEVRYQSSALSEQWPSRHKRYWTAGSIVVIPVQL